VAIPGALFGCATASVVMIGALSLLAESRARHVLESWINIHALFALMLFALLLARHQSCVNRSMPLLPADIRVLSRQLSRLVYLLMYGAIGIRLCVSIVDGMWRGGAPDLNDPKGDFPLLFTTALLALALVRVMAFRLSRASTAGKVCN
jgi:hypothetical protein